MRGLSIGEVARRASVRPSAIRYYESLGLVAEPERISGKRRYDRQVLERLPIIRFAKHVGFKVAEIKQLLDGTEGRPPPKRWRNLAKQKRAEVDDIIARAIAIRKLLDNTLDQKCPHLVERGSGLRACPYSAIAKLGQRLLPTALRNGRTPSRIRRKGRRSDTGVKSEM
jgi:MerR family transcriptional regulator, redox-sensitive transcriptional activator SoxR